jgi:hypothetical protein
VKLKPESLAPLRVRSVILLPAHSVVPFPAPPLRCACQVRDKFGGTLLARLDFHHLPPSLAAPPFSAVAVIALGALRTRTRALSSAHGDS